MEKQSLSVLTLNKTNSGQGHVSFKKREASNCFYSQSDFRHGDSMLPYVFPLCAEVVGILIRNKKDIQGY